MTRIVLRLHTVPLIILLLLVVGFFAPMILGGKTFQSPDWIAARSWTTAVEDAREHRRFPLWNPYIFCGMPSYGSLTFGGDRTFDLTSLLLLKGAAAFRMVALGFRDGDLLFYYFLYAVGIYLLAYQETSSRSAAIIGAASAVFSASILNWAYVGHHTKIATLAFLPFVFFLARRLERAWRPGHFLLLVLAMHYLSRAGHAQMIFYAVLALAIYWLHGLAGVIRERPGAKALGRIGLALATAAALAFLMSADLYLSVQEYLPYSMRGSGPTSTAAEGAAAKTGGLSYEYATRWSFAPREIVTFIIPSWFGFGKHEFAAPASGLPVPINSYWGPQPFVDAPPYLGILTLVLASLGLWRCRRLAFARYLGILSTFALLLSFGGEFRALFEPLFRYMPILNKFRAPSMILCLVQFAVPLLAAFGTSALLADLDKKPGLRTERAWRLILPALALVSLASFVAEGFLLRLHSSVFPLQSIAPKLAQSLATSDASWIESVYRYIARQVTADIQVAALLLLAAGALYRLALGGIVRPRAFAVLLLSLICFDLWRVGVKPRETTEADAPAPFGQRPGCISFLLQDQEPFRVRILEDGRAVPANSLAFWRIADASGYHGAKMRAYQDIVDQAGLDNPQMWQLMNVRYILSTTVRGEESLAPVHRDGAVLVYRFRDELPRAFFVRRYEVVDAGEVLRRIAARSFNPREVAFLSEDPGTLVDPPTNASSVALASQNLNEMRLRVTATGNHLLFLSEAYYPKGWRAFIDGDETRIHRANHLFRALVVPPGSHSITLAFEPQRFTAGRRLSLSTNIGFLGFCLIFAFGRLRKLRKTCPTPAEKSQVG